MSTEPEKETGGGSLGAYALKSFIIVIIFLAALQEFIAADFWDRLPTP